MNTTGERIQEARKKKGFTQKELAEKIGVTEQTVGNYETDNRNPNLDTLALIAKALGESLEFLYSGKKTSELLCKELQELVCNREEDELDGAVNVTPAPKTKQIPLEK